MNVTNLKIERIRSGILQYKLATQIGIVNTKLSMIETGRLEPEEEVKIACSKILKKPIKDLFPSSVKIIREDSV